MPVSTHYEQITAIQNFLISGSELKAGGFQRLQRKLLNRFAKSVLKKNFLVCTGLNLKACFICDCCNYGTYCF